MKKFIFTLLCLLVLAGCGQKEPTLDDELLFELQDVNDKEFKLLMERTTNFTEQEIKQNYATLVFDYQVRNGKKFDKLTVAPNDTIGQLMDAVRFEGGIRFMNGDGKGSNFRNGSFERDSFRLVLYTKDFTKEQIRDIVSNYELEVGWKNKDGRWQTEIIPAGASFKDMRGQ
ncbi:membrane lipoprotein lipid attachment site-containing protein [Solibacillus sp. FSL R7-0668]|uniref:LptM family lipoprotein n=1 Tax=Solibacillus sp. FSL R7-0668 TaxID=2921688 RepID=UPI0030F6157B